MERPWRLWSEDVLTIVLYFSWRARRHWFEVVARSRASTQVEKVDLHMVNKPCWTWGGDTNTAKNYQSCHPVHQSREPRDERRHEGILGIEHGDDDWRRRSLEVFN